MTMIALLGDKNLEYITHRELDAALDLFPDNVTAQWIATDDPDAKKRVAQSDAVWVVPRTPYRDDNVVYDAIRHARETDRQFLGTRGGFQYAVVEYARNVTGLKSVHSVSSNDESGFIFCYAQKSSIR